MMHGPLSWSRCFYSLCFSWSLLRCGEGRLCLLIFCGTLCCALWSLLVMVGHRLHTSLSPPIRCLPRYSDSAGRLFVCKLWRGCHEHNLLNHMVAVFSLSLVGLLVSVGMIPWLDYEPCCLYAALSIMVFPCFLVLMAGLCRRLPLGRLWLVDTWFLVRSWAFSAITALLGTGRKPVFPARNFAWDPIGGSGWIALVETWGWVPCWDGWVRPFQASVWRAHSPLTNPQIRRLLWSFWVYFLSFMRTRSHGHVVRAFVFMNKDL